MSEQPDAPKKRTIKCPTCGHEREHPAAMQPTDLRLIRASLGLHLGYMGVPLPVKVFAYYLGGISPSTVSYYLAGERKLPNGRKIIVTIPPHVARRARALLQKAAEKKLPLAERVKKARDRANMKRAFWAERKAQGLRGRPERSQLPEGPEPPF